MFNKLDNKTQLESVVDLTDKAKLSIYKKSSNSGFSTGILEEVYRRGYSSWDESFDISPEQLGFDRVNSFIAGGFASQLDEDLTKACWKGYEAIGMKKKNGKKVPNCVPNCVPKEEYTGSEKVSKDKNNPASRFDATSELVKVYSDDTPGQSKTKKVITKIVREKLEEVAAWQRKEGKDPKGGLNKKGVESYRREHPGSHLQTAVTTKPSKLDPNSKSAKRRKSFCSRMSGMKKKLTSSKTAHDPDSRINKALRKWNCEETQVNELNIPLGTTGKRGNTPTPLVAIRMADGKIKKLPPGKSGSSGGGGDEE